MRNSKSVLFLLFTIYYLIFVPAVFAQAGTIGKSQINPASPLYFLKSVREIIEVKLALTPQVMALRTLEFATRRIREVNSLTGGSREDLIEPTLVRYFSYVQEFTLLKNEHYLSDDTVAVKFTEGLIAHMVNLQQNYQVVTNSRARMSLRFSVSRLTFLEQDFIKKFNGLSRPNLAEKLMPSMLSGCAFLSKEATSSALNEVEKYVYKERAEKCQLISQ